MSKKVKVILTMTYEKVIDFDEIEMYQESVEECDSQFFGEAFDVGSWPETLDLEFIDLKHP